MQYLNGKRLAFARKRRRLTKYELARLADIPPSKVSKIEAQMEEADDMLASRFAEILRWPIGFFYLDDPPEIDPRSVHWC